MDSKRKARITGTGTYLPSKVLKNSDLEEIVETSDEWIVTRTGMRERRIASETEHSSTMGLMASKDAIKSAGIEAKDIELIVVATATPDYIFPSTATVIQSGLEGCNAPAFDIQAACAGFLYGLSIVRSYIESGVYKHVLLVASEKLSSIVNYKDRATCVLFGDGAAACVVSAEGKGLQINDICLGADGGPAETLGVLAGGCRHPSSEETIKNDMHYLTMNGQEVFKNAVRCMESMTNNCLEKLAIKPDDISWFVPHQANIRIIEALSKRLGISDERIFKTIQKYGNTSASSVPIALHELLQKHTINTGELLLFTAFGAGLTYASSVLEQINH